MAITGSLSPQVFYDIDVKSVSVGSGTMSVMGVDPTPVDNTQQPIVATFSVGPNLTDKTIYVISTTAPGALSSQLLLEPVKEDTQQPVIGSIILFSNSVNIDNSVQPLIAAFSVGPNLTDKTIYVISTTAPGSLSAQPLLDILATGSGSLSSAKIFTQYWG